MKQNRIVKELCLTPEQIENIADKNIDANKFYMWRYFIHLQLKRKTRKNIIKAFKKFKNN